VIDFKLPSLGADMDDAMLVGWLVEPGDEVQRGQVVAEVETEKGIIEVECWEDGVVLELLVEPGPDRLRVGTPIARIEPAHGTARPPTRPSRQTAGLSAGAGPRLTPPVRHLAHQLGVEPEALTGSGDAITREDVRRAARAPVSTVRESEHPVDHAARVASAGRATRPRATPMARRIAAERNVDLVDVASSRRDGIIVSSDLAHGAAAPAEPDRAAAMRTAIARSMARSKREIPHYYLGTHIDVERMLTWVDAENADRPLAGRLLPAAVLLKATAMALRSVPGLNGRWIDGALDPGSGIHLGVAVSLRGGGLVAPAIHDADRLDIDETMSALRDLVARARSGQLRSSEMSDATATVTNLGDRGVETAFPVIVPPQVAMIGFGKIVERPVVVDGEVAVHHSVHATLAADHRASDGHTGALLLEKLDQLLQEPEQL
jgi:pyruvate dehydrogenase E2 component (dihydrolipoamide acetyltransferase)